MATYFQMVQRRIIYTHTYIYELHILTIYNYKYEKSYVNEMTEKAASVCLLLCHCNKILRKSNLREERFILTPGFSGFSPSWWRGHGGTEQLTSWQPGRGEKEYLHYGILLFPFYSLQAPRL
jgi:hypothetical protein